MSAAGSRRDGRAVEGASLENWYGARPHRGFESHSLRFRGHRQGVPHPFPLTSVVGVLRYLAERGFCMFLFWPSGVFVASLLALSPTLFALPCSAQSDGSPIEGSIVPAVWMDDAIDGRDWLDLVWIGDSNTGFEGSGWADGFHAALIDEGAATYATPLYSGWNNGNEHGMGSRWFLGLQSVAQRGSTAPDSPQWAKDSFGLGGGKLHPWGRDWANGAESDWLDFAWIPAGVTLPVSSAGLWVYHRRQDAQFCFSVAAPYRLDPDAELVYRCNYWLGTGATVQVRWRRLATASSIRGPITVPTSPGNQWTVFEDVLPAGDRWPLRRYEWTRRRKCADHRACGRRLALSVSQVAGRQQSIDGAPWRRDDITVLWGSDRGCRWRRPDILS